MKPAASAEAVGGLGIDSSPDRGAGCRISSPGSWAVVGPGLGPGLARIASGPWPWWQAARSGVGPWLRALGLKSRPRPWVPGARGWDLGWRLDSSCGSSRGFLYKKKVGWTQSSESNQTWWIREIAWTEWSERLTWGEQLANSTNELLINLSGYYLELIELKKLW
jgi:hypothetical protein